MKEENVEEMILVRVDEQAVGTASEESLSEDNSGGEVERGTTASEGSEDNASRGVQ